MAANLGIEAMYKIFGIFWAIIGLLAVLVIAKSADPRAPIDLEVPDHDKNWNKRITFGGSRFLIIVSVYYMYLFFSAFSPDRESPYDYWQKGFALIFFVAGCIFSGKLAERAKDNLYITKSEKLITGLTWFGFILTAITAYDRRSTFEAHFRM